MFGNDVVFIECSYFTFMVPSEVLAVLKNNSHKNTSSHQHHDGGLVTVSLLPLTVNGG